jgi:hypothetical protein
MNPYVIPAGARKTVAWALSALVILIVISQLNSIDATRGVAVNTPDGALDWRMLNRDPDALYAIVAGEVGVNEVAGCPDEIKRFGHPLPDQAANSSEAGYCKQLAFSANPYKDYVKDRDDASMLDTMRTATDVAGLWAVIFTLFGIFLLFRGTDTVSFWLGVFCLCYATQMAQPLGVLQPASRFVFVNIRYLLAFVGYYALFEVAAAIVVLCECTAARIVPFLRVIAAVLVVACAAMTLLDNLSAVSLHAYPVPAHLYATFLNVAQDVVFMALPIVLLVAAVEAARGEQRRNFLILASFVIIGIVGAMYSPIAGLVTTGHQAENSSWGFLSLAAIPIGLVLTIPTFRVVNVSLANSIAWILATTALAGVLAGVELCASRIIEDNPALQERRVLLQLLVSFGLILTIGIVHNWLEEPIKRLVFRQRHRALHVLREFERRAPYIMSPAVLLETAHAEIADALSTELAIYTAEGKGDRAFERVTGTVFPAQLNRDDAVVIDLDRAGSHSVRYEGDRHGGVDGVAFPLEINEEMFGVLLVAERHDTIEGPLSREELAALARLAETIAQALFAFEARERIAFVADVAGGRIAGEALVERARALSRQESFTVPPPAELPISGRR